MPAARSLMRRRRSSLATGLTQVKPGNYGINPTPSPRALTFAPNVTPGTTALFPPTAPQNAPTRRRLPPGKRLSQGYIPRPPNAFMLFRANFVRQKHVPGSIETNHGSLSKIIGNCWRALPLEEKKYWEIEAKKAKAAHKERYPHYRFRPVHNKKKKAEAAAAVSDAASQLEGGVKRKDKLPTLPAEEERCEAVAQLLLEGKKGEELAEAVRQLDMARALSRPESAASGAFPSDSYPQPPVPLYLQRRPSSVPPPSTFYHPSHPIALPTVPFFAAPGATDGVPRCQPIPSERMWDGYDVFSNQPHFDSASLSMGNWPLHQDSEPLPEVTDASIFQPGWTSSFKDASYNASAAPFDPHATSYSPHEGVPPQAALSLNIGPLDNFDFGSAPPSTVTSSDGYSAVTYDPIDPHAHWQRMTESGPPSTVSGSPARSDASLPGNASQSSGICAPQPQHAQLQFDAWPEHQQTMDGSQTTEVHHQHFSDLELGLDKGYDATGGYDVYAEVDADFAMSLNAGMDLTVGGDYGFCAPQDF
ncbi:hypothetical protein ONZ51_g11101 [Trametes cubensis]|uniref:HMG box domain-containing protein n=1 Tax=Trametes cubensis TaxID=1111947 RepID=A0AAD7X6M0_9APHY|nr:hypothetical protein ONZ51_g11101 [Trametes cubensis]